MYLDTRKTRNLHNGRCVQIEIHFAGPHAHKLEQDFGYLMRTGRLERPSLPIPGYVPDPQRKTTLGYSECDSDKNRPQSTSYNDLYGSYSSLNSANSPHVKGATSISSCLVLSLVLAALLSW